MSMTAQETTALRRAFELARRARENGDHPFGAVLLLDGKIVFEAVNRVESEKDVTSHAELNLIRDARKAGISPETMARATLVSSTEPCSMCAGAIYWSGIPRVVFGCSAPTLARMAGETLKHAAREILPEGSRAVQVIGPALEDEGVRAHRGFWGPE